MNPLRIAVLMTLMLMAGAANAQDASTPTVAKSNLENDQATISPEYAAKLEVLQKMINETLRLSAGSCNASDSRLCGPTPPCDAQGRRTYPWQNCVLAWDSKEPGKGKLVWIDDGWRIETGDFRRVTLGADGKLQ